MKAPFGIKFIFNPISTTGRFILETFLTAGKTSLYIRYIQVMSVNEI